MYKILFQLKKDYWEEDRTETSAIQESPKLFEKKRAEKLVKTANKHFTRAEHWHELVK